MARLVDTSVFIELERRDLLILDLSAIVHGDEVALASISASELLVGAYRASTEERRIRRRDFVESVLSEVPILPFDEKAARMHAWLSVDLASRGRPMGRYDLIIAATARSLGYGLLTHNVRHFKHVPDLKVDEPRW